MKKTIDNEYAAMGLAALLPGMRHMLELMTRAVEEKADLLTLLQETEVPRLVAGPGPVRRWLSAKEAKAAAGKMGWPDDPEERSIEMKRRMALGMARKTGVAPGTKGFAEKMSATRKKAWAKKTPAQKKAWIAAMHAGREKNRRAKNKAARAAKALSMPLVRMEKIA